MNNYLIPANTKRGQLIAGVFKPMDLVIFLIGIGITFLLFIIVPLDKAPVAAACTIPGLICTFLVIPMPYYHNIATAAMEMIKFLTQRQKFVWRGWCFRDGTDK